MLSEQCQAALEATHLDQLADSMGHFASLCGFGYCEVVAAIVVDDQLIAARVFGGGPEQVDQRILAGADLESFGRDPVVREMLRSTLPLLWDSQNYADAGQFGAWTQLAAHGRGCGVAVALHSERCRRVLLRLSRRQQLALAPQQLTELLSDVQMLAVSVKVALDRLVFPGLLDHFTSLTAQERDALHWTSMGKTAHEVAQILGMSERMAVTHINSAMRKLGCANKHQAVFRAAELGFLDSCM